MKIFKVISAALVIFAAGAVTGALSHVLYTQRQPAKAQSVHVPWGPPHRGDLLARMERELELTLDQRGRIETILQDSHERMKKLYDPITPHAQQEFQRVRGAIREELQPEQKERFEEIFHRRGRLPPRKDRTEAPGEEPCFAVQECEATLCKIKPLFPLEGPPWPGRL